VAELPLVVWVASRPARRVRAANPSANLPGKAATVLQFGAVAVALFGLPQRRWVIVAAAVTGVVAAASYWARALRGVRRGATFWG
jgi:CDP-diacylglycerol--glycerol-3-phosphate 3-phosphatidyltransferase/cardiolipin synthase